MAPALRAPPALLRVPTAAHRLGHPPPTPGAGLPSSTAPGSFFGCARFGGWVMGAASRAEEPLSPASLRARVVERVEEIDDPRVLEMVDAVISLADLPYSDSLAVAVVVEVVTQVAERRVLSGADGEGNPA